MPEKIRVPGDTTLQGFVQDSNAIDLDAIKSRPDYHEERVSLNANGDPEVIDYWSNKVSTRYKIRETYTYDASGHLTDVVRSTLDR